MKFVAISGGLGNQMFNYAFCVSLRAKGKKAVLFAPFLNRSKAYGHQGNELKKLFNIKSYQGFASVVIGTLLVIYSHLLRFIPVKSRCKFYKLIGIQVISVPENFLYYSEVFLFKHNNELFRGTWQSEKFFSGAAEKIREAFTFNESLLSEQTIKIRNQITIENSVSVHIRRGDYLSDQYRNGFASACTPEYYNSAINNIKNMVDTPHFYIFTDDREWVSENFKYNNSTVIDHNNGKDSWQDMYLMSQCGHNIIANSSFSWWGAWLNENKGKIVIAPKRWWSSFEKDDVVPESWIRL